MSGQAPRPVPRDPRLPGLAELLAPDGPPVRVVHALAELVGEILETPSVRYLRYWPTKSCVLLWSVRDPQGREHLVSGKLFGSGRRVDAAREASFLRQARDAARTTGTPSFRFLPSEHLVLQLFPLDAKLPGLPFAASAARVASALDADLADASTISYKPSRRCVLRYRGSDLELVGKVFRDERGQRMPARLAVLEADLARQSSDWGIQIPRAYLGEAQLLLFDAFADAEECKRLLRAASSDRGALSRLCGAARTAATGLAALRRAAPPGLRPETAPDVVSSLRRSTRNLERVAPEAARAFDDSVERLAHAAHSLAPERLATAHGAFRHDQLLLRGDELIVLDQDGLRQAGAGSDPGNFLAYLDATAVRRPRLVPVLEACEDAFLEGLDGQDVDRGWLAWYRAAARVKYALRAVLSLSPRWPERIDALLDGTPPLAATAGRRR